MTIGRTKYKKVFCVMTVFQKDVFGRLGKTTVFMAEQLVTIDDRQILMKAGHIPEQSDIMQKINDLLKRQLGLGE